MQKCLPLEHGSELVTDTLEELLNSCRVIQEGNRHLKAAGRNVTLDGEYDLFREIDEIFVLDVLHLFFDIPNGNGKLQRPSKWINIIIEYNVIMTYRPCRRVRRSHHVLGVEHLLSELRNSNSTVLLTTTSS
jgi:hypothetical protein